MVFINKFSKYKFIIWEMAIKDIKSKYLGSYLGVFWGFLQPAITILIYWFIFEVGFKAVPVSDAPFILWFMAGIIPWFFFSEAISTATNSITESSYLVKKVIFPVGLLVLVKITSSLFIHFFFITLLFIMFYLYGFDFSWYNIQVFYYTISTIILLLGLSWISSSLIIFLKDIGQFVNMLLQFFFWLTPIFWGLDMLPDKYVFFFKLNPVYYLVEGYRDSFIHKIWFWEHTALTPYFWFITSVFLILGYNLYKKLRPHFADVL
ncbi:ABC transporter permease [Paenibacillus sp. YYML68]|uniref:ABC transporter permease n=1 Tax=Paenibacillus sp. YYML68 TaxID=2909250 RepID=UPI002490C6A6|nr:ABC transporter permease [Paenibacillus sp. YYML68]